MIDKSDPSMLKEKEREVVKSLLMLEVQNLKLHIRNGRMVDAYEDAERVEKKIKYLLKDEECTE